MTKEMAKTGRRGFLRAAAAGAVAAAVTPYIATRAADRIVLQLAHPDTALHPVQKVGERFAQLVDERTNGGVRIRVFSGGALGSETNLISGVSSGTIDFIIHTGGYIGTLIPRLQSLDLPFLFKDAEVAQRVLAGPIGQELLNDLPAKGIYGLVWGHYGWRDIETTKRPVTRPEDLKGFRIRVQAAPIFLSMFKAVGAVPIVLSSSSEIYLGLSQNVVDGTELPVISYTASKLYEVTKYISTSRHVYNAGLLVANKAKLDSLDPRYVEAIRSSAADIQKIWIDSVAEKSTANVKSCEERGIAVNRIDFDAFRTAMSPVYAEFRNTLGSDLVDRLTEAART